MPLNARETLTLARELADGDTESRQRAAVSRAYYAALWHARARLERDGEAPGSFGENSHNRIWNLFQGDVDAEGSSLGEMGAELKALRVRADYRPRRLSPREVQSALDLAERLLSAVDALT